MSEGKPQRTIGRSIWAVVAGFLVVVPLSIGTDLAMHGTGIFPPVGQAMSDGLFGLALAYRTAYGVLGSYVTARLAPDKPVQHALVGGAIGLVISTVGAAVTWNKGPAFGPHWYPIALAATALPCAWIGGKLRLTQLQEPAAN